MLEKLSEKVKAGLDDYLEFDTDVIWKNTDYCDVYGGATRDILSDNKINDVDFILLPDSQKKVMKILDSNGYVKMDDLTMKHMHEIYKDIRCIFEPITYMKGIKIVQLIKPSTYSKRNNNYQQIISKRGAFYSMTNRYYELISEVDMSCSDVAFNGKLREHCEDAILHCLSRVYKINENAEMLNPDRLYERRNKVERKGFEEINCMDKNKELYRKNCKLLVRSNKLFQVCEEL
jgi:hypothetical protein